MYIYVCTQSHTYICIYTYVHNHTHTYVHIHMYTITHIHMYIYICTQSHTYICIYTYIHNHTHIYIYMHIYTIIYMASGAKLSIIVPRTQLCRIIEASAPAPGSPIPLFVRSNFVKVLFVCIVCLWVSTRHSKGV